MCVYVNCFALINVNARKKKGTLRKFRETNTGANAHNEEMCVLKKLYLRGKKLGVGGSLWVGVGR